MSALDFPLPSGRVLCAVSGGADSVCLLHSCLRLARGGDTTVCAAHYNHCLRGGESDRDERFVRSLCASLAVELRVGRGDVAAYAREHGMGTEEAARELRYAFLEEAADELGCGYILTAHNADDNAETMLMALVRGSGPRGLAGIPPRRGRILRPMLGATRAEIEAYLAENGLEHVEDSTNECTDYTRNRIRKLCMPVLREINPRFAEAAARAGALLREDDAYLSSLAEDFLEKYPDGRVDCAALAGESASIASRAVRMMAPAPLSQRHVEAVLRLARAGHGEADVPGGRFRAGGGKLFLSHDAPGELPERAVNIPGETAIPEAGLVLRAEIIGDAREIHTSLNTFAFQYANICGTICCTARRPGDSLRVRGRGCTKSVKDLLYEKGVPAHERGLVPVLRDDKRLLAVYGCGQAEGTLPAPGEKCAVLRFEAVKYKEG